MNKIIPIVLLVLLSVLFGSCENEEQKALNYVKTEVMPEEAIEEYLMKYETKIVNNKFWETLRTYLNRVCTPCDKKLCKKFLPDVIYEDEWGTSDYYYWTFDSPPGEYDSEKILHFIRKQVKDQISLALKSDSIENFLSFPSYSWDSVDGVCSSITNEAAEFCGFSTKAWDEKVKYLGIDDTKITRERYRYKWTVREFGKQVDFISSVSSFIIDNSTKIVSSNEFKLIDAQAIKAGKTIYQVVYSLKPKLKIIFDVSKVDGTFCCDTINVEGNITWKGPDEDEIDEEDIIEYETIPFGCD